MTNRKHTGISLALMTGTALAGMTVLTTAASGAPAASATFEEIVVSARKRDERLQDVPESITVFTGNQIERANIETIRDFVDLTPNLLIRETFRTNETFLTLRGLSSAQNALPPVTIIIDGVQMSSNEFLNQDLLDIERIEVLKGPQGALYGQGAIAGALNIVTRKPTNEFEGFVKGSYGNGNSYRIAGAVSGPIVEDMLKFRLSGYYRDSDGLIQNIHGVDILPSEQVSVRGQLYFTGENLEVALRGSWTDGNGGCCIQDKPARNASGVFIDIDDVSTPGASSNFLGSEDTRFRDVSLKIDYDFGGVTLTSVSGYADSMQSVIGDLDFTAASVLGQDVAWDTDVINQEVRLTSNNDGPLQWMFGGFYQERDDITYIRIGAESNGAVTPSVLNQDSVASSESWAVFGQASYDITDQLELSAALRYDEDDQTRDLINYLDDSVTPSEATFDELQPKVQLTYNWSDDIMTYVTYSKGFRPGGFSQLTQFDNETTQNYEFGFKTSFADGLVAINAAFFHIDYSNQLLSFVVVENDNVLRQTINIEATDIDGMEIELSARPTDELTLSLGVGVTESTIVGIDPAAGPGAQAAIGSKSPLVPPFTFAGSATYVQPVMDNMDLVLYASYQRRGGFFFDLNNTIRTGTKDFIDGKISLETENWSLGLWGKNLGNTRHATNMSITGADLRVPNQPRSYGIEGTFRF